MQKHNRPYICDKEANYKHNVIKELTKKEECGGLTEYLSLNRL